MNRQRKDDGATLIIVLFIITVVAVVIGGLASSVETSQRTTIGLRVATTSTYTADGAGQIAVDTLRKSTWNNAINSNCFGASGNLALPNVYPAASGAAASSAYVSCVAEAGTGAQGTLVPVSSANKPGNAILTLGSTANGAYPAETGQTYGQSNKSITIRGGVISDSNIDATSAGNPGLNIIGGAAVRAAAGCTGTVTAPPLGCQTLPGVPDPNYPAPAATLVVPPSSLPTCANNTVAQFQPGLYTSANLSLLNNCNGHNIIMHFNPGTYFFDFGTSGGSSDVWHVSSDTVAGTPTTPLVSGTTPAIPGACVNPINSTSAVGVTFVFGGDSQLSIDKGGNFEACASYSATSIPTAFYGLKTTLTNGANTVRAETGCVAAVNGCDVISDGGNGTKPTFYFEGFAYAPLASINLVVNNTAQPFFNFGIVSRRLTLTTTGSVPAGVAFISLPDNSPGYGTADTIVDLTVYVCPGASTCSTSGRVRLRARVDINDPTGTPVAGARRMTILSWSLLP